MMRAGQSAIVTGAGSGIGRAVAMALAEHGMHVLAVGRGSQPLPEPAEHGAGRIEPLQADVATPAGRARVAEAAADPLHVLVHAAGAWSRAAVEQTPEAAWCALDAVNYHGPMLLTAACLNKLRTAGGDVVVLNSTAALNPAPNVAAYAAGKAAVRAATDALRQELSGQGVRVLSVFPGRTDTPMQQAVLAAEGRQAAPDTLMQPEDVAAMVVAALMLPRRAEVTEITLRPSRRM